MPDPAPGPGEVLIAVSAVGLCGTDLKVMAGSLPGLARPVIPGHEVAGLVAEGAAGLEPGTRVAAYLYEPCGDCRWCLNGHPTLCPDAGRIGRNRNGGLAGYMTLSAENALPFSDSLDFEAAAVTMDAVATPWRALTSRAELAPGEHLAIAGAGGLGMHGIQIAVNRGARVAVLDPRPEAREHATALGAELAIDPRDVARIVQWSGGGFDVGLEASGTAGGLAELLECAAPAARLVCCGYSPEEVLTVGSSRLVLEEMALLGSRASSRDDAIAALAEVSSGRIRPLIGRRMPFEAVNAALEALASGSVAGRIVVEMPADG